VPTISFQRVEPLTHLSNPSFIRSCNPCLLHGPFGMAEDRIQHHLLSCDQFVHIRLGVVASMVVLFASFSNDIDGI
jgi:hypothetical protein